MQYPILPPITRIESVRAATVAMRSSGQMMVVMIDAGTTMPPIPRPAIIRRIHKVERLSRVATASEPHPFQRLAGNRNYLKKVESYYLQSSG